MGPISEEERPHIEAMKRAMRAGFRAVPLADAPVIHAERWRQESVDTYTISSMTSATAARWRVNDYGDNEKDPLWQTTGTVAEVIVAVLALR
ncbi:hypothetical protein SAMN05421504_11038 [Amycolatopsis xylanica]|uniref:Uncharacterized protein n=1 Tax=Amycolatopsis xylanica TaxID=589385 RepID=A0A1H3QSD2_9PSEU|nr:hypothetical protein [Amycolatopsis xylanica]SDZ15915.1 hypothetical protein SAMN05421504_11038 [Amycolatopsis xylanica]